MSLTHLRKDIYQQMRVRTSPADYIRAYGMMHNQYMDHYRRYGWHSDHIDALATLMSVVRKTRHVVRREALFNPHTLRNDIAWYIFCCDRDEPGIPMRPDLYTSYDERLEQDTTSQGVAESIIDLTRRYLDVLSQSREVSHVDTA